MTALLLATGLAFAKTPPPQGDAPPSDEVAAPEDGQPTAQEPSGDVELVLERLGRIEARLGEIEEKVEAREETGPERRLGELKERLQGHDDTRGIQAPDPGRGTVSYSQPLTIEEGEVADQAVSFGGPVFVEGEVRGDAVSMGSDVIVHSGGIVDGNAVSIGGAVHVDEGAIVRGDRVAIGPRSPGTASVAHALGDGSPLGFMRGIFRQLAVLLCFAGAGVLVMGLWPGNVDRVAVPIRERPFWYGIAGAILVGVFGFGSLILAMTLVGLPLAMLLSVVLAVAWLLGIVAVCKALGERFAFVERHGAWAAFLAGAAVLALLSLLPWVGPVLMALVGLPAVGAAVLTRFGNRRM